MAKPSWFDSSNKLWEICDPSMSARLPPIMGNQDALPRIRSLWLISFIQDTRTLMNNWLELYSSGISNYTALQTAVVMLHDSLPARNECVDAQGGSEERAYMRLACILFIVLIIQSSVSCPAAEDIPPSGRQHSPPTPSLSQTAALDAFLLEHKPEWSLSIEDLYRTLFHAFPGQDDYAHISSYALHMATVISYMSQETRRGLERTLLNILPHVPAMGWQVESEWTPDALLSSIHGD